MPAQTDRVVLDISYADFDYAITACLERCETEADCDRLVSEILRVMNIRQKKEQQKATKQGSIANARQYRWNKTQDKTAKMPTGTQKDSRWYNLSFFRKNTHTGVKNNVF